MTRGSLSFRLGLSAAIILLAFLGLAGVTVEKAFDEAARKAMEERLQAHIYALLATFEIDPYGQVRMNDQRLDNRFSIPGSGLYGFIFMQGQPLWRSVSALGVQIPYVALGSGRRRLLFRQQEPGLWILYYGVVWETERGHPIPLVLAVAEDAASLSRQIADFRQTLWSWLGGSGIFLLITQVLILLWSLKPLRTIAADLEAIEAGKKRRLAGPYPKELGRLATNLNILLESERAHLERYRNTLADLAHSLKTPLAVLMGMGQSTQLPEPAQQTLSEQLERMQHLVDYQLKKAAAQGSHGTLTPIAVLPVLERIRSSLDKIHREKAVVCRLAGKGDTHCFLDEGDLYEIAGNLLDNAYKWCRRRINVRVDVHPQAGRRHPDLYIRIEDDGPGIPESLRREVLKRGIRADQSTHGHGIGLAVVNELVTLHRGRLVYYQSPLGGAGWEVCIPSPE